MTSSSPSPDYTTWSTSALIARITALEQQQQQQHPHSQPPPASPTAPYKKPPRKPPRPFDATRYPTRLVALKFAYLGAGYHGFENSYSCTPRPTVEEALWRALCTTRLVDGDGSGGRAVRLADVGYTKAGRTDVGVSAFGQVVGLRLRSRRPRARRGIGREEAGGGKESGEVVVGATADTASGDVAAVREEEEQEEEDEQEKEQEEESAWDPVADELPYMEMLNRVLPHDIRVLAWCPDPPTDFSARYDCKERQYRYYFTNPAYVPMPTPSSSGGGGGKSRAYLDIAAMRAAASKYEGLHDFRNLCKIDATKQLKTFARRIFSARIQTVGGEQDVAAFLTRPPFRAADGAASRVDPPRAMPELYYLEVRGSAFLYHQVRHLMAVLFLVGQGYEQPSIVDELLDIDRTPAKPVYEMASEIPLVLWDCIYPHPDDVARNASEAGAGYQDAMNWIHAGDEVGGLDAAKRRTSAVQGDKYARWGIMRDLWVMWQQRKMDELLAGALMNRFAGQMTRAVASDGDVPAVHAERDRVHDGSAMPRIIGKYKPLMERERISTPDVINARFAARRGLQGGRVAGFVGRDHRQ